MLKPTMKACLEASQKIPCLDLQSARSFCPAAAEAEQPGDPIMV